jgi:hypothetical protein
MPQWMPPGFEFKCATVDEELTKIVYAPANTDIKQAGLFKNLEQGAIVFQVFNEARNDHSFASKNVTKMIMMMMIDSTQLAAKHNPAAHISLQQVNGRLASIREECSYCRTVTAQFKDATKITHTNLQFQ